MTVGGPQGRSTITVNKPFARIGSHLRSEVVLKGAGIDLRCLYLHATPEGVFCVRLLPTQRITLGSGSWLKPDELVQVGPYTISARLQRVSSPKPPLAALTAWGSAAPPLPVCEILVDGKIRDKRRFRARLNLIGRRRGLALQLQGQQVSGSHCALYWDSGRLWCIDLLSSNGTLLQDQPVDCALLEIGQSLQIGEYSLLLKRLSRSAVRRSAWRTGESDDDVLAGDSDRSEAEAAGSTAQTTSVASGDTGKAQPTPVSPPLVPAPNTEVVRARQLLPQATQEVASHLSHLHAESARLEAQRQAVARLRAEWQEQRRILTDDLTMLKRELAQREALQDDARRLSPLENGTSITPVSKVLDDGELSGASVLSGPEMPVGELTGSQPQRGPLPTTAPVKTVIEGSFVVERESPRTDISARRAPFPSNSPLSPLQPGGRRHSWELRPEAPAPTGPESEPDADPSASSVSTPQEARGLAVVDPSATSSARHAEAPSRWDAGRRKQADEDLMGAFVTERMVLREEGRRFWLRVLWGTAAAVSLLALTALGYIVLSVR